jgi:hypothetical protein
MPLMKIATLTTANGGAMSRKTSERNRCRSARQVMAGLILATMAAGCATTMRAPISNQNYCPFLGNTVCAKLSPTNAPGRMDAAFAADGTPTADLRYINPNANWTQYNKVLIHPVTFWAGDTTKVSAADQQILTNFFYTALQQQLSTKFQVVDSPGPGVMTIQVAIEDATTATPVLRSISVAEPHVKAIGTLKYLATGTYPFVGSAQAEAKITDSVTGQVLAAAVDKRVGGGSLKAADQWELGDAENAITAWAQQMTARLAAWTSGKTPP